jgi:hypothetical protein
MPRMVLAYVPTPFWSNARTMTRAASGAQKSDSHPSTGNTLDMQQVATGSLNHVRLAPPARKMMRISSVG